MPNLQGVTVTLSLLMLINGAVLIFGQTWPEPQLLGESGGKEFYVVYSDVNNNLTFNWTEAKAYCKSFDMDLASIETSREMDFLGTFSLSKLSYNHWIDGRDSHETRQLSWDKNNGRIPEDLPLNFYWLPGGYQTCATYHGMEKYLDMLRCSLQILYGGALCERVV